MFGMRRREFITLLGGVAAAWPLAARAQQRPLPVIGLLSSRSPATDAPLVAIMREGIKETGLVEGQNSPSIIVLLKADTIGWPRLPPISCIGKWRSSLRSVARSWVGSEGSNHEHTNRLRRRHRSGAQRDRSQLASPRRQRHWRKCVAAETFGEYQP